MEVELYPSHLALDEIEAAQDLVVELEINQPIRPWASSSGSDAPIYWMYNFIGQILAVKHGDLVYDLEESWKQQKIFEQGLRCLGRYVKASIEDPDNKNLDYRVAKIYNELIALEGQSPYSELNEILQTTIELLNEPTSENLENYEILVDQLYEVSPRFRPLGVTMLALGGTIAALGLILTPALLSL